MRTRQEARLRFSTLNKGLTPELQGTVLRVSGDLTRDPQGGAVYYLAAIAISEGELAKLGPTRLLPGMPVEAFMATAPRSIASYLVKPLRDHFQRAMRES